MPESVSPAIFMLFNVVLWLLLFALWAYLASAVAVLRREIAKAGSGKSVSGAEMDIAQRDAERYGVGFTRLTVDDVARVPFEDVFIKAKEGGAGVHK